MVKGLHFPALRVLEALFLEQNVTRAARRLNLTQPAVSHTLAKLRKSFNDPLFVAVTGGIAPTPLVLELREPVQQMLALADHITVPRSRFNPETYSGSFSIATTDYIAFILLSPILARLRTLAPGLEVEISSSRGQADLERLRSGELHLAIWNLGDPPATFHARTLFSESYKGVVRKGHPRVGNRLMMKDFINEAHLEFAAGEGGLTVASVDALLSKLNKRRRIVLTIPHFLLAPLILAESDLLGIIAERTARRFAKMLPLKVMQLPVEIGGFSVTQVWHARRHTEPIHQWMRGLIADVARTV
jgi:DNA-binding transcriptional LysR family regulator